MYYSNVTSCHTFSFRFLRVPMADRLPATGSELQPKNAPGRDVWRDTGSAARIQPVKLWKLWLKLKKHWLKHWLKLIEVNWSQCDLEEPWTWRNLAIIPWTAMNCVQSRAHRHHNHIARNLALLSHSTSPFFSVDQPCHLSSKQSSVHDPAADRTRPTQEAPIGSDWHYIVVLPCSKGLASVKVCIETYWNWEIWVPGKPLRKIWAVVLDTWARSANTFISPSSTPLHLLSIPTQWSCPNSNSTGRFWQSTVAVAPMALAAVVSSLRSCMQKDKRLNWTFLLWTIKKIVVK